MFPQPLLQVCHLAFAEAGGAGDAAGIATVDLFRLGGDEVFDAQGVGDGAGDEAVGGGDDEQGVAGLAVFVEQRQGLGQDDGLYFFRHEPPVQFGQPLGLHFRQGLEAEFEEFEDIQRASLVFVQETQVFALVGFAIDEILLDQKAAPQIVAVPGQQGVVEVENCQAHGVLSI